MRLIWQSLVLALAAASCSDDDSPGFEPRDAGNQTQQSHDSDAGVVDTTSTSVSSHVQDAGTSPDVDGSLLDASDDTTASDAAAIGDAQVPGASVLSRPSLPRPPLDGRLPADLWPPRR